MLSYILVWRRIQVSLFIHTFGAHLTPLTNRQTESATSVESLYFWLETLSFSLNTYSKNSPWKGWKGHLFERIIGWEETFDSHGPMVNPPRPGTSYRLLANEGPMKRIYPSQVIFNGGVFRNEHHHVGWLSNMKLLVYNLTCPVIGGDPKPKLTCGTFGHGGIAMKWMSFLVSLQ